MAKKTTAPKKANSKSKAKAKAAKPKKALSVVEAAKQKRHIALLEKFKRGEDLEPREIIELEGYENQAIDNPAAQIQGMLFATQKQAADYAGVSTRTIRNWVKEGMPMAPGKQYAAVYLDAMKKNDGSQADVIKDRRNIGDAENKELKNLLLKMTIDERKGILISLDEVEEGRIERIQITKTVLLGLARKLPPLLKDKSTREMTVVLRKEIEHCINIFSGKE